MTSLAQRLMHCPSGSNKVLALELCVACYTVKRQDEEYFGRRCEAVLERDGYRCRVCDASGQNKRSIIMISLCSARHANFRRTRDVVRRMSPLLLQLRGEAHPRVHKQTSSQCNLK